MKQAPSPQKLQKFSLGKIQNIENCFNTVIIGFTTVQLALVRQLPLGGSILREKYSLQLQVLEFRPL